MKRMMIKIMAVLTALLLMATALVSCAEQETESGEDSAFCVVFDGVKIELGKPAEPILEELGPANSENEVFDCGEGNSRVRYRYDSFTLYVMKSDGEEVVDQIELLDDLTETSRGVCIGDGEAKVREAYGTPTSDQNGILGYSKSGMQIQFDIADGKVSAIGLLRRTQ